MQIKLGDKLESKYQNVRNIELKNLTKEQLQKKKDSLKLFTGTFIALIVALSFFVIRDYLMNKEFDWVSITMVICTIGGFLPVYQELKLVEKELKIRN